MKADSVNRWLTLGANFGVVVGIILLLVQLDQNATMMRAQTRNELFQGSLEVISLTAQNAELADIIVRSNQGEPLTPAETFMYGSRSELVFRYWENVHYQYRHGLYDESEFSKHLDTMKAVLLANDGLTRYWCQRQLLYAEPFSQEIDKLLFGAEC